MFEPQDLDALQKLVIDSMVEMNISVKHYKLIATGGFSALQMEALARCSYLGVDIESLLVGNAACRPTWDCYTTLATMLGVYLSIKQVKVNNLNRRLGYEQVAFDSLESEVHALKMELLKQYGLHHLLPPIE